MAISKILIVDDSPAELNYLRGILTEAGFDTLSTNNGHDAVDIAQSQNPDLIFLDIIMPGIDGFATCRLLQQHEDTRNIPIIFVTSKNQRADRLWAQMQGARAFITKPYEPDVIIDQIKALQ